MRILKDTLGWGLVLWLVGYVLGMLLFALIPPSFLGWVISPVGIVVTLLVLYKKITNKTFPYYLLLGVVWVVIGVVCDYIFLVRPFHLESTYYKPDIYIYYALMLLLPLVVGWRKSHEKLVTH